MLVTRPDMHEEADVMAQRSQWSVMIPAEMHSGQGGRQR